MDLDVKKSTGVIQEFDHSKLYTSMQRAGVRADLAQQICRQVFKTLKPGDSTNEIFRETFKILLGHNMEWAARYALERAVDSLGPAGFLFEQYVEAILQSLGFNTRRNVFVDGECVTHEIDVLANKGNFRYLVEAKYRNGHKMKTHIDQVMYADARLEDIRRRSNKDNTGLQYQMFVVTNAYFTQNSIQYAQCRNMRLLGWKYPKEENLINIAEKNKLYPITVLPSLTNDGLAQFAKNKIILLHDLLPYSMEDLETRFGIPKNNAERIYKETQSILKATGGENT